MKRKCPILTLFLILAFPALLASCGRGAASEPQKLDFFAMDTIMEFSAYADEGLLEQARDIVMDIENRVSTTSEGSELYRVNRDGGGTVSAETAALLETALSMCRLTGGAFDVSIYPVVKAWGFTTGEYRVPSFDETAALLENVGYARIRISETQAPLPDETQTDAAQAPLPDRTQIGGAQAPLPDETQTDAAQAPLPDRTRTDGAQAPLPDGTQTGAAQVTLPDGMEIDLGGVAKGYAGREAANYLRGHGVTSALLNLGGNVQTIGSKPDGSPWRVAIRDPKNASVYAGVVEIRNQAAVTSGGYERCFTADDGQTYWHIMDPETGRPARNGVLSATVIAEDGALCDALSTALFVMGPERAERFWRNCREPFEMVLITEDGEALVTSGLVYTPQSTAPYAVRTLAR